MNRGEFIKNMADRNNISILEASVATELIFDSIKDCLVDGEKVSIRDFGVFDTYEAKATKRKVPNTDEIVDVNSTMRVKFKVSKKIKELINNKIKDETLA